MGSGMNRTVKSGIQNKNKQKLRYLKGNPLIYALMTAQYQKETWLPFSFFKDRASIYLLSHSEVNKGYINMGNFPLLWGGGGLRGFKLFSLLFILLFQSLAHGCLT